LKLALVEATPQDLFMEQPLKGVKAQCMNKVLHDWHNAQCRDILNSPKPALKAGYNRILINEIEVPNTGADWFSTSEEMLLMVTHSVAVRKEKEWRTLVESVVLESVKIRDCGMVPEKLIDVDMG
jgi:hypothetical protein